jgi:GNAT superfamily N-acetyltransferase
MAHALELLDDPLAFADAAAPLLAAEPVRATVIGSTLARLSRPGAPRPDGVPHWWAVVRDEAGRPVSAAMRTAPLPPHPPYLLEMPDDAARLLARTLHERGEEVTVVNGFLPAIEVFAREIADLTGGADIVETERTTLYELGDLAAPADVPGRLRIAVPADVDLVQGWFDAFGDDASEQAGRPEPHPRIETRESTAARVDAGEIWIWETPDGTPAQVTAFNPTSSGVARVGPVYTPKEHRGRGYAAAAVAAISRRLLDEGARVCLFADEQNTTSTGVYVRLGYRPVAVTAGLRLG